MTEKRSAAISKNPLCILAQRPLAYEELCGFSPNLAGEQGGKEEVLPAIAVKEASFVRGRGPIDELIDGAYRAKYKGSQYLSPMIGKTARAATVRVVPRESKE